MLEDHMTIVLIITGAATASMFFQFLSPQRVLRLFNQLEVEDNLTLFFARVAGLAVSSLGLLLIWAGLNESIRLPVVTIALVGKTLFVLSVLKNWDVLGRGFALTVVFDTLSVALYAAFLIGGV